MVRSTVSSTSSLSSSSSLTPPSENTSTMPPKKMDKKAVGTQRIVVLKIDPAKLAKWAPAATTKDTATVSPSNANSTTESSANSPRNSSPLAAGATPQVGSPVGSAVGSTVGSEAPSVAATGAPGAKPGPKRGRQPGAPAGKPGRKKQKLDNGATPTLAIPGTSGPHKLGPKANQGAINAQLRALDRTGRPCKKWTKAGFQLKSFTGFQWTVPTWATPAVEKKLEIQPTPSKPVANSAPTTNPTTPLPNALNSMGGTILDITMTNA